MMEKRLEELRQSRDAWDNNHGKELKSSKTSETARRELQHERNLIVESINRQKKALTSEKQKIRKSNKKQQRILERTEDKRVVEKRLELNSTQRIFTSPVRFNVRVHNISKHYFDSCTNNNVPRRKYARTRLRYRYTDRVYGRTFEDRPIRGL
jgi:hypothetical protein